MDTFKTNRKKHIFQFVFALMLFSLWVYAVYAKCGIYFETNDDRVITEILSGVLGVKPEVHTVHVNVFLSVIISTFYEITASIPWYGSCLIFFHIFAYALFLYFLLRRSTCLWEAAVAILMAGSFAMLNIGTLAQIQYTSTAALLAMTGYACLTLEDDEKCSLIVFAVLELLSTLLRDQAMLMIQPLGMSVFVFWILTDKKLILRQKIKKIAAVCAVVLAVLAIAWIGVAVSYGSDGWEAYRRANNARERLFDYGEKMPYEMAAPILDKYGVTEIQYNAFLNYTMLDGELSPECIQELAEFWENSHGKQIDVKKLFTGQLDFLRSDSFRGLNRVIPFLWMLLLLFLLMNRKFSMLIPMAGLLISRVFVWAYLIHGGRLPQRVLSPLFACEILLLLVLFVKCYSTEDRSTAKPKKRFSVTWVFAALFLLLFAVKSVESGREQYRYAAEQNRGQEIFFAGARELQDYCGQHPERQYYVESLSQAYYVGSALETEYYLHRDYMTTGCWYFNSPAMNAKTEEFRNEREEGIYLIIYAYENPVEHPAVLYFEEKMNRAPVQTDSFTLSHGGSYLVYYFDESY